MAVEIFDATISSSAKFPTYVSFNVGQYSSARVELAGKFSGAAFVVQYGSKPGAWMDFASPISFTAPGQSDLLDIRAAEYIGVIIGDSGSESNPISIRVIADTTVIDSTVFRPAMSLLYLSSAQTTGIADNSPVLFDSVEGDALSLSSGRFTLPAGRYLINAALDISVSAGTTAHTARLWDVTADAGVGRTLRIVPSDSTLSTMTASPGPSAAIVSPTSATQYEYRLITSSGIASIRTQNSWLSIMQAPTSVRI